MTMRSDTALVGRSIATDVVGGLRYTWINSIGGSALVPRVLRLVVYRLAGLRVGRASIFSHVTIAGRSLHIGDGAFINRGCYLEALADIHIGREAQLGMRVTIATSDHPLGADGTISRHSVTRGVVIGDKVWIGTGAIVLPGVSIGEGTVIAAGAVVTKDCRAGWLYGGVPAAPIRALAPDAALPIARSA